MVHRDKKRKKGDRFIFSIEKINLSPLSLSSIRDNKFSNLIKYHINT